MRLLSNLGNGWRPRLSHNFVIAVALLGLWAVFSIMSYRVWVHGADHRDFYPRWAGIRLLLSGTHDLYSPETTRAIQIQLYGAPLPPDRDQQGFAYPALLAAVILPFALIPDVEIATAVWQGFSLGLITLSLFLLQKVTKKSSIGIIVALILWPFTLLMLFQGQITAIPLAAVCFAIVLFDKHNDFLAGAVLSFGLVKPELVIAPVAAFLAFSLILHRLDIFKGFISGSFVILTISIFMAGWWFTNWFQALKWYSNYAKVVWPIAEVYRLSPIFGLAIMVIIGISIFQLRRNTLLMLAASVPIGMLLLPQTLTWSLTMLTIPLALSWRGKARIAVGVVWLMGWLSLLGLNVSDWWKVQATLLPFLCLLVVLINLLLPSQGKAIQPDLYNP